MGCQFFIAIDQDINERAGIESLFGVLERFYKILHAFTRSKNREIDSIIHG